MLHNQLILTLISFAVTAKSAPMDKNRTFELSLIHLNDFHARYEEISASAGVCKDVQCVGGFARVYTAIRQLAKERPNPVVLNGGDNFQGTLWYNIYKWNVTQHFFNLLPTDAYTLGNHEFDGGIKGLVPYLKALKAPTAVSNIDDSEEPSIQGLYNKSIVIDKGGKRIGIVGVISQRTHELSSTGKLRFLDESESVNREAERLVVEENVNTIIVLSHCGYEAELEIARKAAPKIGVIVGAHSHTFLYTGEPLPGPDKPEGPYPTIINHQDGRHVLVVQASAYGKYIGNLTVKYNENGDVISWSGAPIYLDHRVPQDEQINQELAMWAEAVNVQSRRTVGETKVLLEHDSCRYSECSLGNFVTDAMVNSQLDAAEDDAWTYAAIAVINAGGLRTSIPKGNITYGDLVLALPFTNTMDSGEIQGRYLKQFLEFAAGHESNTTGFKFNLMPVSGLRVVYNMTRPIGSRIQSLKVRCRKCTVPHYEELDTDKYYRITVNSFIAGGGDGHTILAKNLKNRKIGKVDIDILKKYVEKQSPVIQELQDRIVVVQ